ncbi:MULTISPECIES: hypothetical protein [unclassified Streptomyces]|uniref:hypothetical protein n=1 Tax=unclassified Streptomyces TaxID=2593676 RepID=UPI002DDC6A4F|nr:MULTISPECIES: hypothetical protein [unclassified Streptomyces]WSF81771.1 hypothetical protein OIE70_00260 [Streptomyces sp. NBC_01744]WSC34138.1 hypothetical protein OHA08_00250 [Streptomyces sp. NBC_01763]WSC41920.1 hypothetical protein OHA08_44730 [Streptomyces sp. NBC_01763]WSC50936.1 hypothetical protein OG808_00250 [Streptomyces sp. NBC_01761]WSC58585.1 hypothetical protein OG808_44065 [Streptomyces sp. NBC_01761]
MRRLRLENAGHRSAGFKSLELDLTGGTSSIDGRQAAAVDVILWLRNGGGKSSLLSLIFSLLLPAKIDFIGHGKNKSLADYVPDGQVSHVVVEWGNSKHPEAGPALVTGGVYQWRGGQRPADVASSWERLERRWYVFRPLPGVMELDTLPVRSQEGQLSLTSYVKALEATHKAQRRLNLVVAPDQFTWAEQLASNGLDPELFKVQRDMNKDEGGITELFTFKTCEDFADFLIDMVVDEAAPSAARASLCKHADKLATRPDRELEGRFLAEAVLRLKPVQKATAGLDGAQHALVRQMAVARRAGEYIQSRAGHLTQEAGNLARRAEDAKREAEAAVERGKELERRVAGLDEAVHRAWAVERAEKKAECKQAALCAKSESSAWKQVPRVLELSEHEDELRQVNQMLADLGDEQAPLREAMEDAGTALYTKLTGQLAYLQQELPRLQAVHARAKGEVEAADQDHLTAVRAVVDAQRRAESTQTRSEEIEQALASARAEGLLQAQETAQDAMDRIAGDELAAREEQEHARVQRERARVRRGELAADRTRYQTELGEARRQHEVVWDELNTAQRERDELTAELRLRELASATDEDVLDLVAVGADLADLLDAQVEAADVALAEERAQALDDQRVREALERDGFCPPPREVEEAVAALRAAGVDTAVSGLQFLRETVPAHRHDDVLAAVPHLIGGVVVCGPAPATDLTALVRRTGLSLRGVVAVGTQEQATILGNGNGEGFTVLPVHPAALDADAAERELRRLTSWLDALDDRLKDLTRLREKDRALAVRLRTHLRAFGPEAQAGLEQKLARLDEKVNELTGHMQDLDAQASAVEDEDRRAAVRIDASARRLTDLAGLVPRMRSLVAGSHDLPALFDEVRRARGEEREHQARVEELAALYQDGQQRVASAADGVKDCDRVTRRRTAEVQQLRRDLPEDLLERAACADQPSASLQALGERWARARQDLANGISDRALQERRATCEKMVARLNQELGKNPETRRQARVLAAGAQAADTESLEEGIRAAEAADTAAQEAAAEASVLHRQALEAHQAAVTALERFLPAIEPLTVTCASETARELEVAKESLQQAQDTERSCCIEEAAIGRKADKASNDAALLTQTVNVLSAAANRHEDAAYGIGAAEEPPGDLCDATLLETHGLSAATASSLLPEGAERICGEVTANLDQAARSHTAALRALDKAVRQVERLAQDPQYLQVVDGRLRNRLEQNLSQPRRLAELLEDIEHREGQVTALLGEIAEDQAMVVRSCTTLVEAVLHDLDEVARHSRLPKGLGSWSDERFLSFEVRHRPREEELERRLAAEIDRLIAALPARATGKATALPEAMPLTKGLVLAALGGRGNIVAKIIKPTQNLDTVERESVTVIQKFSGGELLTVSVLLYCTLARMRAAKRDRRIPGGVGTLVMDNPFGKANYGPFIALQRRVAAAHGIQLVYTTGTNDLPALGRFPLIIRLRNGVDLRTRRRYVQVTDRYGDVVARAAERAGSDGIAAARLLRHPLTSQAETEPEVSPEAGEAV